ncbi:MAG: vWA domain-containing protein [Spirochaetia bacterium]|nr:vWA domain-containing protein [Spirochaetia bacterium]
MNRRAILVLSLVTLLAGLPAETRSTSVDFIMLVDTSLSMADAIMEAKKYAAGEVIGRLVEPGDWVCILKFYGRSEIVWQGDVGSESDKAAIVRSLNLLEADGRFTDIGSALDDMDALILDRGQADRPKYILLLTDEIQEAPKDSPYYSGTFEAEHPLLEYVKRVDMGSFRVITIGYGLSARIELEARALMTTLSEPPLRSDSSLAGAPQDAQSSSDAQSSLNQGSDADRKTPDSAGLAGDASNDSSGRRGGFSGAPIAASLAAAGALAIGIAFFLARKKHKKDDEDPDKKQGPEA